MLTWIQWIALVASICEPLASDVTGYESHFTCWFTRSIAAFDWSDLHCWTLFFADFRWWNLHGFNGYWNTADLIHSDRTRIGVEYSCCKRCGFLTWWLHGTLWSCTDSLRYVGLWATFPSGWRKWHQRTKRRTNKENHGAKANEKRPATSSALAVVDDHPESLQRKQLKTQ